MTKPKIGIALGSGGARGWSHIGVLQALKEAGMLPDIVCGCSMGALVGGTYIAGVLDRFEEWALSINRRDIVRLLDIDITGGGLIDGNRLMQFLQTFKEDATIESYDTPFMAIATDLATGREVWLRDGSLSDAIRASVSIPGVLKPYRLNGKWLLDGGLTNPVPVSACRALGAEIIIAVNPNADNLNYRYQVSRKDQKHGAAEIRTAVLDRLLASAPDSVKHNLEAVTRGYFQRSIHARGYFDVLTSSIDIMTDQIRRSRLAGEPPHILLDPQVGDLGTLEFNRAQEAIAEGRRIVQESLPQLEKLLE